MNATKKQYQLINNTKVEYPFGSIPGLEWNDAHGNTYRAFAANLLFYNSTEVYIVVVDLEVKPQGTDYWLFKEKIELIADDTKWRSLLTQQIVSYENAHDFNSLLTITNHFNGNVQDGTYNVIQNSSNGNGIGAEFEIQIANNAITNITITNTGSGYNIGDTIVISGTQLNGIDGDDNILIDVESVTPVKLKANHVTNGKFFSIALGYNPTGAPIAVFEWIYIEIAEEYGLTIIS